MKTIDTVDRQKLFPLSLDDLEISDVKVEALTSDLTKGLPEMAASTGTNGCCTCGGNPSNCNGTELS
jgi:hypothetical protein